MTAYVPSVREIDQDIYLAERPLDPGEPDVAAVLVRGQERAAIVDTLTCPQDMMPFQEMLRHWNLPVLVINTHADWDHAWGNLAFSTAPIIGHALCRDRLVDETSRLELHRRQQERPDWFASVVVIPPHITFQDTLRIDLGGLTLVLHHLPGHTPDSLVAHIPQRGLLLAGDCVETPFPLVGDPAHLALWASGLRTWSNGDLRQVAPCHGRPGGTDLLDANATYLEALVAGTPMRLPDDLSAFYRRGHDENVAIVRGGSS